MVEVKSQEEVMLNNINSIHEKNCKKNQVKNSYKNI
jgi:hypothetical protein